MLLYDPGDRVVVRKDLAVNEYYSNIDGSANVKVVSDMARYAGKTVTISSRSVHGPTGWELYHVEELVDEELGDIFWWTDCMFEGHEDGRLDNGIEQSDMSITSFICPIGEGER